MEALMNNVLNNDVHRSILSVDERLSNSLKIVDETMKYQEGLVGPEPSAIDQTKAVFNEFGIGFRGLMEGARNKSIKGSDVYNQPKIEGFVTSDTFQQLVKDNNVSTSDARELMNSGVGNEAEFLWERQKQERYNQDQKIIEQMSPLSLVASGIAVSVFDPSSWLLGGAVGAAFKGAYTGAKVGQATLLGLRAAEGATTAGLINYATELSNQQAAGVSDTDKLTQLTAYGAAFGLALPVLPTAITQISQGAYRKAGAMIASEYVQSSPVTASMRKYLSLGAGEQTKWQSQSPIVQDLSWKIAPSAGVRRDAMGQPIVQTKTAMDLKGEYVERPMKEAMTGLESRANEFGGGAKGWAKASEADGRAATQAIGLAEQKYGQKIGSMTGEEQLRMYKQATGLTELPEEAARLKELKPLITKRDELVSIREAMSGTTVKGSTKGSLTKKINTLEKKIEELQNRQLELPEDAYNVIRNHLHKEAVASGEFVLPKNLEYIGKYFKTFSENGTKLKVPGVANKEGYGFYPIRYNRDMAIANPTEYKQKLYESIKGDSYTQAKLDRGLITEEDILEQVESLYKRAERDDVRFKYIDRGVPSGSGSSSKARRLNINRTLHPDLFLDDVVDTMGHYGREMGGRFAFIESLGIDPYKAGNNPRGVIENLLEDISLQSKDMGISPKKIKKDADNLRAMLEGILDVRRLQSDPNKFTNTAVRTLKGLASTAFSAGFVKYNMVEWLSGATHSGFQNTIQSHLPAMKAVVDDIRKLPTDSPEFDALKHTVLATHSLMGHMFSRLDANELTGRLSFVEQAIHNLNTKIRKYTAFNITTDINEAAAAGGAMRKLFSLDSNNLKSADADWLSRYGFTPEDLKKLQANKDIIRDSNGKVIDYNMGNWKDSELESSFSIFMERASRDVVPVPNASSLHRFQSDVNDPIKSLFFQYSQIPTVLWDKIFLSALDRPTADSLVGFVTATIGMYSIFKLDDEMKVRLGLKGKLTPDIELYTRAMTSTSFTGVAGMFGNAALSALGQDLPGVTFMGRDKNALSQVAGAGGSIAIKIGNVLQSIGQGDSEKALTTINNLMPINAVPILGNFYKQYSKGVITDLTKDN